MGSSLLTNVDYDRFAVDRLAEAYRVISRSDLDVIVQQIRNSIQSFVVFASDFKICDVGVCNYVT